MYSYGGRRRNVASVANEVSCRSGQERGALPYLGEWGGVAGY